MSKRARECEHERQRHAARVVSRTGGLGVKLPPAPDDPRFIVHERFSTFRDSR